MARARVVKIEITGDLATLTVQAGCCGKTRTQTVALPTGQTPDERLAELRLRYPGARIVMDEPPRLFEDTWPERADEQTETEFEVRPTRADMGS